MYRCKHNIAKNIHVHVYIRRSNSANVHALKKLCTCTCTCTCTYRVIPSPFPTCSPYSLFDKHSGAIQ